MRRGNGKDPGTDTQDDGKPLIEIAFNTNYLTEVLAVIPSTKISLDSDAHNRPGVIRGVKDYGEVDNSFLYVLMPMQLSKWGTTNTSRSPQ